jgi:hypothetical protein
LSVKKFLTKKTKAHCPSDTNFAKFCAVDQIDACADFGRFGCAIVAARNAGKMNSHLIGTAAKRAVAFVVLFSALVLTRSPVSAADELVPPFGFRWNDPMSRVDAVLKGAKASIVSREKKEGREVWTVEGLVHPGLKRTLFTFKGGSLFGVELQYEYPDWTIERYNERMGEIRRYFDSKYGTGKLVSRTRDTDSDVIQTLVGYQWTIGATMLELFYFSAQHDALVFRTISVDYKAL